MPSARKSKANLPAKKRQPQASLEEREGGDEDDAAAVGVPPPDLAADAASQDVEDQSNSKAEAAATSGGGGGGGRGGGRRAKSGGTAKAASKIPAAKKKTKAKSSPTDGAGAATKPKASKPPSKRESTWSARLAALTEFKSQHGHTRVPRTDPLSPWVVELRSQHSKMLKSQKTSLTPERIAQLEALDFEWKLWTTISWEERLETLRAYVDEHGHCNVPIRRSAKQCLGTWVDEQRKLYRKKQKGHKTALTDERERQLNALGFQWYVYGPTDWSARLQELRDYKAEFGTCAVQLKFKNQLDSKWKRLANWVSFQRLQYKLQGEGKKSLLTPERKATLDELGFIWTGPKEADGPVPTFESRLEELRAFKAQHGHCDVPTRYAPNTKMANWIKVQRRAYKRREAGEQSSLTDERMKMLEDIGFKWKVGVEGLRSTRRMNAGETAGGAGAGAGASQARSNGKNDSGGGDVLGQDDDFTPLDIGIAVAGGIAAMETAEVPKGAAGGTAVASATASAARTITNSSSSGFVRNDDIWNRRLEELSRYKSQHGNCSVPSKGKDSPNPALGKWVMKQRVEYRKFTSGRRSQITQDRIDRLNDLEFDWNPGATVVEWPVRLEQLRLYREEFGHCNVPKAYPANPALGQWVQTQRVYYKKLKAGTASYMTQERIESLEALDFVWHVGKGKDGRKSSGPVPEVEEGKSLPDEAEGGAASSEVASSKAIGQAQELPDAGNHAPDDGKSEMPSIKMARV